MSRIVYVDGQYVDEKDAKISVFDRGFLFADAVYEVTAVLNSKLVEFTGHLERLQRSCRELSLAMPVSAAQLKTIHEELIKKNNLVEGGIYLQISRGNAGDRDFAFPGAEVKPTLVLFTQSRPVIDSPKVKTGIKVVTMPDIRWHRRDIKTVGLLAPCLAKEYAHANDADDAFLVENGFITEGSSSNAYIVLADNTIVTRPLSNDILHGITRKALLVLAARDGIKVEERLFTPDEAYHAKEAFISSATTFIWPVVSIDGKPVGNGKPGPISLRLRDIYVELAKAEVA